MVQMMRYILRLGEGALFPTEYLEHLAFGPKWSEVVPKLIIWSKVIPKLII